VIGPWEFEQRAQAIRALHGKDGGRWDPEALHGEWDSLCLTVLRDLGYDVDIMNDETMWYA
jgi:hypothetical protein